MDQIIGDIAGKIWQYLNDNGPATVNKLINETGLGRNEVQRGVGWLAREGKITIEVNGRIETIILA